MFAVRDQENLVHAQQTAAAAKPMNQGVRQIPPKTPANKAPKTPFRLPLNDENAGAAGGFGKSGGLKSVMKGNKSAMAGGKKKVLMDENENDNFITPMGKIAIYFSYYYGCF